MSKNKDNPDRLSVTVVLPRDLAEACLAVAEDPHEFRWGPFFRSLARKHLEQLRHDPRARLRAAVKPNA